MSIDSEAAIGPLDSPIEPSSTISSSSVSADNTTPVMDPSLQATTSSLPSFSQPASSATVEPPTISDLRAHRKDRHGPSPAPVPSNHHAGQAAHFRAQSTLSPHRKALLPCALRVGASLVLLFIIAVCMVELGDAIVLLYRWRVRGRGYSNSGRLRLDEEETSEKSQGYTWRPWRR
ncbi:hypothetical protein MMC17_005545 [Xylographa soralifera]|nr:hypothetical protein [Xylographa soralifera]